MHASRDPPPRSTCDSCPPLRDAEVHSEEAGGWEGLVFSPGTKTWAPLDGQQNPWFLLSWHAERLPFLRVWSAEHGGIEVNEGQLGRALIEQKAPWWVSEEWARDDPDLRELANVPFEYRPLPLADIAPDGLYLLLGPRRVGKSVELKRAVVELVA